MKMLIFNGKKPHGKSQVEGMSIVMKHEIKRAVMALLVAGCLGLPRFASAQAYITNLVCDFSNFNLSIPYAGWVSTSGGTVISGSNGYEVIATGYGSGAYYLPAPMAVPAATKAQLTFKLNTPSAGTYYMGPNFDITSDLTNQVQFTEYANYKGGSTNTVTASLGTLNPANITAFNVEMDPAGYGYTQPYDITFLRLVLLTPITGATPVINWTNPAAIAYGMALGPVQLNATALFAGTNVSGSFTYNPPAGTILQPGNHTLQVTFIPSDRVDLMTATASVDINVIRTSPKPVMMHYMPWFQTPYSLGGSSWGLHWTMNHFNPNLITNGYRQIDSWFYPLIGPYDSIDPAVLEYHVLLMKLGGIDGVIVDWYGQDNYYDYAINDARTLALLNFIQKAGLKFALCYEDATIGAEINGGAMNGITVTTNNAVAHAQQTMNYVQSNYFASPNYLRWNGQPVLLDFGPQYFMQSTQWTAIFSTLAATNQPAFFTLNNLLPPVATGAFSWIGGLSYRNGFQQQAATWPAFISTAFPRYHDIYAQAGGTSFGYQPDDNGSQLTDSLAWALTNNSVLVQVATWNDYGEGTIVEPTVAGVIGCGLVDTNQPTNVYGYTDLGIIQDLRRKYLEAGFPYQTNDLALALRLYNLRKQPGSNPVMSAELDRVFSNIISGNLPVANLQLTGAETSRPVIYNLSVTNGQLQFSVGGFLSAGGIQIETSADLVAWHTNSSVAVGTQPVLFSTSMSSSAAATFFRVQE
jgi:hypothetical protein